MRISLLLTLALFFNLLSPAQSKRGTLVDAETRKPIEGAYVCALTQDSLLVTYTYTDEKGFFEIVTTSRNTDAHYLYFSFLGYEKRLEEIAGVKDGETIALAGTPFQIREVKITSQRIREEKDTLTYSVAGFAMPQDRSIADVIAKMPGLSIQPNGQIEFQGRAINRFYIEGMNLMDDKYTLASNNISKKQVKEIQVLRNHQPIELLRGKSFTEQAAINLVLEDNAKVNFTGSIDVEAGGSSKDALYSNRLLAMMFNKKRQNLSLYKNDNTGEELQKEITSVTLQDWRRGMQIESNLISAIALQPPGLDNKRYSFNRSHLVASNHLKRTRRNNDLRIQTHYYSNVERRKSYSETNYLLIENAESHDIIREDNALRETEDRIDLSVNYEINNQHTFLKNKLSGSADWLRGNGATISNDRHTALWVKPVKSHITNDLSAIFPLKSDRLLSVSSLNTWNYLPQELAIYTGSRERVALHSFYSQTSSSFQHKMLGIYVKYQVGWEVKRESLRVTRKGEDSSPSQQLSTLLPYIEPSINYKNNWIEINALCKLTYASIDHDSGKEADRHYSLYLPEPSVRLAYRPNGTSTFHTNYRFSHKLPTIRNLYTDSLFTSYRHAVIGGTEFHKDPSQNIGAGYRYSQPMKGLFFSLTSSWIFTRQHTIYENELSEESAVLYKKAVEQKHNTSIWIINSRLAKSFNWWKSFLTIQGSFTQNKNALLRQQQLTDYKLENYSVSLEMATQPTPSLSFEGDSRWIQSRLSSGATNQRINQFRHSLSATYFLTKSWRIQSSNSFYQTTEKGIKNTLFSDLSTLVTFKQWEFECKLNNLWGRSAYEREVVSSIENTYYSYRLRPREFLVRVSRSLF